MTIKTLAPALSVSPQILPKQVANLATAGFKSIICNLPDGACGQGQPGRDQIAAAAKSAGLQATYLYSLPGQAGHTEAAAFCDLLTSLPSPIIAFCRSGNRSASLWAMSQSVQA
ncbi:MAG: beta-lactamase hydrolase domain-containing protein [Paracoccaceae bacterium]